MTDEFNRSSQPMTQNTPTPQISNMSQMPQTSQQPPRRGLLLGLGATAALAGAGLAWWRLMPGSTQAGAEAEFWKLELEAPEGHSVALSRYRGRPLLLNFWATWCPPCIEELPMLNDFYAQNSAKGWQILGLAVDQAAAVRSFISKTPLDFPILMAGAGGVALSKMMGNAAGGLPFSVVFSADGNILTKKIGKLTPQTLASWRDLA